jgi:hypothetical protein
MRTRSILAAIAALAIVATPVFAAGPFAQVDTGSSSIDFHPTASGVAMKLTVSGPDGFLFEKTFDAGAGASFGIFDGSGDFRPDGVYTWRLDAIPELNDAQRGQMADLRASGSDAGALQKSGKLPAGFEPMSGSFAISQGSIVAGGEAEPGQTPAGGNRLAEKTQVIAMDLIVQGSECVGQDCTASENFGFDTLRLKENNLRIAFDDTSNSGSFPTTDWTIVANDSANGGESYLAFQEDDASTLPFKVRNGAGNNAFYVHTNGNVGLGTGAPALQLQITDGNTPGLRLEQNGSSGFTPQTWDLAGNEANFFVRDVTNGSQLSFRIEPGADTNSLYVDSTNDVGIGTNAPAGRFHVKTGSTDIMLAGANGLGVGTSAPAQDLEVTDMGDGNANTAIRVSTASHSWDFATLEGSGSFTISKTLTGVTEMNLDASGNLTITGMLNTGSSREIKHGFEPVDGKDVLRRVAEMPLATWIYNGDSSRHLGPMAEDFYAAFQLGADDKHIAPSDKAGVALAAIQGLNQVVEQKDQQIEELRAEVEELKRLVRELAVR